MSFKMNCPHCKRVLNVTEKAFGKSVPCPACKQPIAIPREPECSSGQRREGSSPPPVVAHSKVSAGATAPAPRLSAAVSPSPAHTPPPPPLAHSTDHSCENGDPFDFLKPNELASEKGQQVVPVVPDSSSKIEQRAIASGRFRVEKGSECKTCKLWFFSENATCSQCKSGTQPIQFYHRFCWERLAFIGMWFLVGFVLAVIQPGFCAVGPAVAFLYGMASYWMGVGKLTEKFGPNQLEEWSLRSFSWQRFWIEWIYFVGVIIAVIVTFIIIVIVTLIFRFLKSN